MSNKASQKAPAAAQSNSVPATQTQGSAVAIPEWAKGQAGVGTEGLTNKDIEMPRIKLIQGISEELQIFDGLKAGDFFHTLAEQSLGQSLEIVPIFLSKRYVLWRPRPPVDQGGILARADDGVHWVPANASFTVKIDKKGTQTTWKTAETVAKSGLDAWGTFDPTDSNSPPAATECHVIVVAMPKMPELSPVALFLQRSAITPTRKLLGKLKISAAPIYAHSFIMSSFADDGPSGPFQNYRFTSNGFVQDAEQGAHYKTLHEQFKRTGVKVKIDDNDEGGGAGGASGEVDTKGKY